LAETVWTLKGKRYRATKEDIITAMTCQLRNPTYCSRTNRSSGPH
jgi:hypothetical protein